MAVLPLFGTFGGGSSSSSGGTVNLVGDNTFVGNQTIVGQVSSNSSFIGKMGAPTSPTFTFQNDGNSGLYAPAQDILAMSTNGLPRLVISTVGNIGVGTATPSAALTVVGIISSNSGHIGGAGSVSVPTYAFVGNTNTGLYSSGTNNLGLTTNGTNRLNITSTGNVGIGNILGPLATLSVLGTISGSSSHIAGNGSTSVASYSFVNDPNTGVYSPAADNVALLTNGTNRLNITSTGNVGIGNIRGPLATLSVLGTISGSSSHIAGNGSTSVASYSFVNDPDTGIYSPVAGAVGILSNGTNRLFISSVGHVGVSTLTPSAALSVVGPISASATITMTHQPAPATPVTSGGVIYVEGGALKYKGSNGTVTVLAPP